MRQLILFVWRAFRRARPWLAVPGWLLATGLLLSTPGCAGAPAAAGPTGAASSSPAAPPSPTLPALPANTLAAPAPSPSGTERPPAAPAATPGAVLGLQQELALANQEMDAAGASGTLPDAQQHAQAAINTLVGAWGRWYDVGGFNDPSDRRGVLPGERIPGPANDTSSDLRPIGWGIRAYDQVDPAARPAIQAVMGDVKPWRDNPRAGYDAIQRAIAGASANLGRINQLDGRAPRALAWARLIVAQAATLAQAQQYAQAGSQETGAALAAAQSIR